MTLDDFINLKSGDKVKFRNNEYIIVSVTNGAIVLHNSQIGLVILREDKLGRPLQEWGWELDELEKV